MNIECFDYTHKRLINLLLNIDIAANEAFIAPALPIARVGKGTPAGIWTIERRLSIPFNTFDSIGTPSTGVVVSDAIIPGK